MFSKERRNIERWQRIFHSKVRTHLHSMPAPPAVLITDLIDTDAGGMDVLMTITGHLLERALKLLNHLPVLQHSVSHPSKSKNSLNKYIPIRSLVV